jgi:hypothetical protein
LKGPVFVSLSEKSIVPAQGGGLVAHACNPSYIGSRNQEDLSSKPAQTSRSFELQNTQHKIRLVE